MESSEVEVTGAGMRLLHSVWDASGASHRRQAARAMRCHRGTLRRTFPALFGYLVQPNQGVTPGWGAGDAIPALYQTFSSAADCWEMSEVAGSI